MTIMGKCKKCGAYVQDGVLFCTNCKQKFESGAGNAAKSVFDTFGRTEDFTNAYSARDIAENKLFAAMCYIPILCLFPIIFKTRRSGFVRFHANGGLMLFLLELALSALFYLLGMIPVVSAILALPLAIASWIVDLAFLALTVYGVALAYMGRAKELPFIGKIRIFK